MTSFKKAHRENERTVAKQPFRFAENPLNSNERSSVPPVVSNAIQRYFNIKRYSTGF